MNYDERASLINSLQQVVGKPDTAEKAVKRFNASTGTIYCTNDVEYNKKDVYDARALLDERRHRYEKLGDAEGIRLCNIASAIMEIYLNDFKDIEE